MYSREERMKATELYVKYEMFYNRSWAGVSIDEFMDILDEYLHCIATIKHINRNKLY